LDKFGFNRLDTRRLEVTKQNFRQILLTHCIT